MPTRPNTGGKAPGEQSSLYMVQNPALAGRKLGPQFTVPDLAFSPTAEQTAALNNIEVSALSSRAEVCVRSVCVCV